MYSVKANSVSKTRAAIAVKESEFSFGITPEMNDQLASPAELFLGSVAACILKNVERFSVILKFEYETASVEVKAVRLEKPPRMDEILYSLKIYSNDSKLNIKLLQRNIEKFGTIYNTVKLSCKIEGSIERVDP
ncbi:MAG: OsmC family peroxiredoxin [Crocinitomix sp.]|nr:OsmC family peroxiredoxin [Crocinitomix sp.]